MLNYPVEMRDPSPLEVPLHRWGTVTQASPLRVRLDGDDDALVSDPWDMGGPRRVGERVYCQVSYRRVVILGPDGKSIEQADLTPYLKTSLWSTYGTGTIAAMAVRWGPLVFINGAISPKTGHPWLTTPTSSQELFTGIPDRFRMRPGSGTQDAGWPRQPMTSNGSWYVYQSANTPGVIAGGRVDAASAVSTDTWFPFGIWGFAADAISA